MAPFRFALLAFIPVSLYCQTAAVTADRNDYFEKNVRPVLIQNCQPCHNAKTKSSGLDLSSAEGFAAGGASGALLDAAHPEAGHLVKAIGYEDSLKMPPMGKLKPEQLAALTNWVQMGAPWPGAQPVSAVTKPAKKDFTAEQKAFWAFQPVHNPALPAVKNTAWVKSPIDRFILAKLEERGIAPAPPSDRASLLRRATFDLTGLPPTERELREFLADRSPNAFATVVDRLLASPRYGERWGRHWLDVARYADSTGNDEDHRYPYAYRYRDYVIDAFNSDLPYDRFVREQIAGDLLPPAPGERFNAQGVVATGFLALGAKAIAQVDKTKMLYDVWDEQVDVTSRAFLGLTMACARCHDHKFDPILTKDYYSMVGMFANTRSFEKVGPGVAPLLYRPLVADDEYKRYRSYLNQIDLKNLEVEEILAKAALKQGRDDASHVAEYLLATRDPHSESASHLNQKILSNWKRVMDDPLGQLDPSRAAWKTATDQTAPAIAADYQKKYLAAFDAWESTVQKSLASTRKKLEAGEQATAKLKYESPDPFFTAIAMRGGPFWVPLNERKRLLSTDDTERVAAAHADAALLQLRTPPEPDMADAVGEETTPIAQKVAIRGDFHNLGEDAPRAVPAILSRVAPPPTAFTGSGRLQIAEWLTRADNPLVARVMMNRTWMWHFGEGIVSTPDNFGRMGGRPSNPELLDFLASQFVTNNWSMKSMQRMLMLSSTYQMATDSDEKSTAADPENALFSRFNRQRLDIEEIRDSMLAIDGTLDLTMHGTLQKGFGTDGENSSNRLSMNPEQIRRRTVYIPLRRANLPTLLNLFDFGDATTVNGKRSLTNVAPQALFMMNSEFVSDRARNIAKSVLDNTALDGRGRMEQLYLRTLDRTPSPDEIDAAFTFMDRLKQRFNRNELELWQSFCHVLLTSNEFIYLE